MGNWIKCFAFRRATAASTTSGERALDANLHITNKVYINMILPKWKIEFVSLHTSYIFFPLRCRFAGILVTIICVHIVATAAVDAQSAHCVCVAATAAIPRCSWWKITMHSECTHTSNCATFKRSTTMCDVRAACVSSGVKNYLYYYLLMMNYNFIAEFRCE